MLNYLWTGMLVLGMVIGAVTGHMQDISEAVISSSQDAVQLCITMLGVMAMWTGVLKIAEKSGLLEKLSTWLRPALGMLFPDVPKDHPAGEYIATNCVANILGLGWAATPAGLRAMELLGELNGYRKTASNAMCTFLILNISSLQLIPVSIIAYRSQYGSAAPTAIVGPAIAATMVSTIAAIVYCKVRS